MSLPQTEQVHDQAQGLDCLNGPEVLAVLLDAQIAAAKAVRDAIPDLVAAAGQMAQTIRAGHNLIYAAAGSSGLMALADGLEITPTFGISNSRIKILRAGGLDDIQVPSGAAEDDTTTAHEDASVIKSGDCVICLAASGNTPYPVAIMQKAREVGAKTIGIANNAGTLLITGADIPVVLLTPPEVIAGSTRLGAATAQKIALNMMSTLMGIRLGHVVDGLMVNVIANNAKLNERAKRIVMAISGCDEAEAGLNISNADGSVKLAILLAAGAKSISEAQKQLDLADQNLRTAMSALVPD
ncbi:MAG: N-acetylmuramic acid 6-phosphate etherase [Paracoccaceae bacterium]